MNEINTWPGWECVRLLGEGTFGKVYEIQRRDAFGTVRSALKVITIPNNHLHAPIAMSLDSKREYYKQTVEKIYREITLMDQLKGQSNIVSYMDHSIYTPDDGASWTILIRMSLLTPFSRYLESHEMTIPDVIRLGIDIGRALRLCHSKKILHRDVKPENIFVNPDTGDFAIGDFGISRTLEKEMESNLTVAGTYNYMAPEVFRKKVYGYSADIYSLAMVLYELLNDGNPPFMESGSYSEADRQQAMRLRFGGSYIPAPKHGSIQLVSCILKALSYDTNNRFESADAFIKALQACPEYEAKETSAAQEGTVYAETPDFTDAWDNNQQPAGSPVYSNKNSWNNNNFDANRNNADYSYGNDENNFHGNSSNYSKKYTNNYNNNYSNNPQNASRNGDSYSNGSPWNNGSGFNSQQNNSEKTAAVKQQLLPLKEKAAQDEAAREKAARDKAAQEKAAREKAAQEKTAREKAAREKAAQEKAAREKAAREKAAREKAAQEKTAREKAAREKAAQEKAAREKAAREKVAHEKAAQEKTAREKAARDSKAASAPAPAQKGNFFKRHPILTIFLLLYGFAFANTYYDKVKDHKEVLAVMETQDVTDHVMEWNDDALEAKMREITGIKKKDIYLSDVWTLKRLNLYTSKDEPDIKNISALGELTNLEDLNISSNEISDISVLASLRNLTSLDISNNNIMDVSPLTSPSLSGLTRLNISNNNISDVFALYSLTNLEYLRMGSNQITDIQPIGSLTNLKNLSMEKNPISDISALASLTNLTNIYAYDCSISDISSLRGLSNLEGLHLSRNQITDGQSLSGLTRLTILDLGGNQITDISFLANLILMRSLDLDNNEISDISYLSNLTALESLSLSDNAVSDLSPLSGLTALDHLYLGHNQITDISPVCSLPNLEYLSIYGNDISDRSPLDNLPSTCELSM